MEVKIYGQINEFDELCNNDAPTDNTQSGVPVIVKTLVVGLAVVFVTAAATIFVAGSVSVSAVATVAYLYAGVASVTVMISDDTPPRPPGGGISR